MNDSFAQFRSNEFKNNERQGVFLLSGSNAQIGHPASGNVNGNLFYKNGVDAAFYIECAELHIVDSYPDMDGLGNDFVDPNTGDNDQDTVLISAQFDGDPEESIVLNGNYFYGDLDITSERFWFHEPDFFDTVGMRSELQDDQGFRPTYPYSISYFRLACLAEENEEWEDAATFYMVSAEQEHKPAALNGWVRCEMAQQTSLSSLIEELDDWVAGETLNGTAFWLRISVQNCNDDYETSIAQLDTFIEESESELDSLQGLLCQLNTYYQMYLAGYEVEGFDGANGESSNRHEFHLPQLGRYAESVPTSRRDFNSKRDALMAQIMSSGKKNSQETAPELPLDFALAQPYPNPFNSSVVIPFALPSATDVRITVFDVLGREVTTLLHRTLEAGRHQAYWHGTDKDEVAVASGAYFFRMETGDFVSTRKALLLK